MSLQKLKIYSHYIALFDKYYLRKNEFFVKPRDLRTLATNRIWSILSEAFKKTRNSFNLIPTVYIVFLVLDRFSLFHTLNYKLYFALQGIEVLDKIKLIC